VAAAPGMGSTCEEHLAINVSLFIGRSVQHTVDGSPFRESPSIEATSFVRSEATIGYENRGASGKGISPAACLTRASRGLRNPC
jgi:hypothetical protein